MCRYLIIKKLQIVKKNVFEDNIKPENCCINLKQKSK